MEIPVHLILVAAIGGAVAVAVVRSDGAPPPVAIAAPSAPLDAPMRDDQSTKLPPNHPPIGAGAAAIVAAPLADEGATLTWSVPSAWQSVANPNTMRLATYRVATGDETEVAVSRAGGAVDANIERWVRQFDGAGREVRQEKTVRGHKITIVEVSGTFLGGAMTPGAAPTPRVGWTLVGAIVETEGAPYFFKMTGPSATVRAAHAAFDAMLASVASP